VFGAEHEHERDAEHQVTPLELFFDLVVVFAITQVTKLLACARDPGARGARPRERRVLPGGGVPELAVRMDCVACLVRTG
jgi:hypothetical protein